MFNYWLLLGRVLRPCAECLIVDYFALFFNRLHEVSPLLWTSLLSNLKVLIHPLWVVILYLVLEMAQQQHLRLVKKFDEFCHFSRVLRGTFLN